MALSQTLPALTAAQALLLGLFTTILAVFAMNADKRDMAMRVLDFDHPLIVGAGVAMLAMSTAIADAVGGGAGMWAIAGLLIAVFGIILWRSE